MSSSVGGKFRLAPAAPSAAVEKSRATGEKQVPYVHENAVKLIDGVGL